MMTDQQIRNYWAKKLLDQVTHDGPLITLLRKNMPEPTRWQRFKWRLHNYWLRCKGAWRVLKGDAYACDDDY